MSSGPWRWRMARLVARMRGALQRSFLHRIARSVLAPPLPFLS